jgi:hypothetical protein
VRQVSRGDLLPVESPHRESVWPSQRLILSIVLRSRQANTTLATFPTLVYHLLRPGLARSTTRTSSGYGIRLVAGRG